MPSRRPLLALAVLLTQLGPIQAPARSQVLPPLTATGAADGALPVQLSITTTRSLNFGRFVATTGGTLTVAPGGARSRSGGVVLMSSAEAGSAGFSLAALNGGADAHSVVISLPADGEVFLSNGQATMPVRGFASGSGALLTLTPSGAVLDVGATLTIAPQQPAGSYAGSFQVTVNYE